MTRDIVRSAAAPLLAKAVAFADATANAKAVKLGHHPIEQGEARSVQLAEFLDGFPPVRDCCNFIPCALESFRKETAGQNVIISDQYLHERASTM